MKNYRTWGKLPYKIAVVHGGPGATGEMAPVADELSKTFGVLEPLQTRDSVEGQIEELADVLEKHADLPAILIGHSWGAWLVYITAARHPALVKKIILIASGPFTAEFAEAINTERLNRLSEADRIELLKVADIINDTGAKNKEKYMARLGALAAKADTYDALPRQYYELPEGLVLSAEILNKVWPEAAKLRASGRLLSLGRKIQCPVIAIHGDYDTHLAEGVQAPLSRVLKDFRFILLEKCGHEPWMERYAKDKFFKILKNELK
jgi:pimeloyl-ACP methyl ester carboxylesterase